MEIVEFPEGPYAVKTVHLRDPGSDIGSTWQELVVWREQSAYKAADHQWLEHHFHVGVPGHDFDLDLYLPIAK